MCRGFTDFGRTPAYNKYSYLHLMTIKYSYYNIITDFINLRELPHCTSETFSSSIYIQNFEKFAVKV